MYAWLIPIIVTLIVLGFTIYWLYEHHHDK